MSFSNEESAEKHRKIQSEVYCRWTAMLVWNVRNMVFFRCCSSFRSSSSSLHGVQQWKGSSGGHLSGFGGKSFVVLLLTAASCCSVCNFFDVLLASARSTVRSACVQRNKNDEPRIDEAAPTAGMPVAPLQENYTAELSRRSAQKQHSPLHGGGAQTERSERSTAEEGGLKYDVEDVFEKAGVEGEGDDVQAVRGPISELSGERRQHSWWRKGEFSLKNEGTSLVKRPKRPYAAEPMRREEERKLQREREKEEEGERKREDEVEKTEGRVREVEDKEEEAEPHMEKRAEVTTGGERKGESEEQERDIDEEEEKKKQYIVFDSVMEKELEALEKSLSSPYIQTPIASIYAMIRDMNSYFFSTFGRPLFDFPFPFQLPSSDQHGTPRPRNPCRLTITLDPLFPMEEARLYLTLSDRRVRLAANRRVKRSEKGKACFRAYGSETRVRAVASIPDECMLSKKLVKAGLIGWSYGRQAPDGSKQIVVTFPSATHAEALLPEKWVTRDAYKALLAKEGLEKFTPLEKCLLSGRTHNECDQLRAEAREPEKQHLIPSFSSEGYGKNEVRLPRFVYT